MIKLNLISPVQQNILKKQSLYYSIENLFGLLIIFLIIIVLILVPINQILTDLEYQVQNKEQLNQSTYNELNSEIKEFNETVITLDKLYTLDYDWLSFMKNLSDLVPNNVNIIELSCSIKDHSFNIIGFAKTRDDYLEFKDNLSNSENYNNLETPLSDILKRNEVSFTIKGTFN